jgi:predicted dithiol-disulfide oxidoreductase (DUF899 family)
MVGPGTEPWEKQDIMGIMAEHKVGTREEYDAARQELLKQAARDKLAELEAEQATRNEEIKKKRLALPWVRVEKEHVGSIHT